MPLLARKIVIRCIRPKRVYLNCRFSSRPSKVAELSQCLDEVLIDLKIVNSIKLRQRRRSRPLTSSPRKIYRLGGHVDQDESLTTQMQGVW
ncbi:unnamed protein product [Calypogeia fissa]